MTQAPWRLAAIGGLAAALGGCGSMDECRLSLATTLPIRLGEDGHRLLVPAQLGDRSLSLIVDTGAMGTMITRTSLPKYTDVGGSVLVQGIGGGRFTDIAQLRKLTLGRLRGAVPATVTNEAFVVDGQPQDGLLGMDILGAYELDVDVPGRELRLYQTAGDCSHPAAALQQPLYAIHELHDADRIVQPRVAVTIQGRSFVALLDSGSPITAMFKDAATRLGIDAAAMAGDRRGLARGVGTRTEQAHVHMVDEIDLGELEVRHVPVEVIDENVANADLLLGMDFMRRVHVWISGASHTVVLQLPPQPSPPLPGPVR